MAPPESSVRLLRNARDDILTAEETFKLHEERTGVAAYLVSQYIEKSIKSKLVELDLPYPRTHNITALLELLPDKSLSKRYVWQAVVLTSFAAVPRCDDALPTVQSVRDALVYAKDMAEEISKIR
ncbi:MAG: HEPN domain-containing protein [Candidatus Methanoplasma sp.]|jgi:HEPN domain-containing protein|nr:HEPN domain-containing protein [Candidatus Methanoplasma sp.]